MILINFFDMKKEIICSQILHAHSEHMKYHQSFWILDQVCVKIVKFCDIKWALSPGQDSGYVLACFKFAVVYVFIIFRGSTTFYSPSCHRWINFFPGECILMTMQSLDHGNVYHFWSNNFSHASLWIVLIKWMKP